MGKPTLKEVVLASMQRCTFFGKAFFPKIFFSEWGWFHHFLEDALNKRKRRIFTVAMPRGWGKSKFISMLYVAWRIMFRKEKYVILISHTLIPKGQQMIRDLKRVFEDKRIVNIFGDMRGTFWTKTSMHVRNERLGIDCVVQALGIGQQVTGASEGESRPTLVIIDDGEDPSEAKSTLSVTAIIDWFNIVLEPAVTQKDQDGNSGQIIIIGTTHAPGCFLQQAMSWKGVVSSIKIPVLNEHGESNWPERFTTQELCDERDAAISRNAYSAWMAQKMLEPKADQGLRFDVENIKMVDKQAAFDAVRADGDVWIIVDLAYSQKSYADNIGITVVLHRGGGRMLFLESHRKKVEPGELAEFLYNIKVKYRFAKNIYIGIESKAMALVSAFFFEWGVRNGKVLDVIAISDGSIPKNDRIASLVPFFSFGLAEIVERENDPLLSEMQAWFGKTVIGHDDVLDSAAHHARIVQLSESRDDVIAQEIADRKRDIDVALYFEEFVEARLPKMPQEGYVDANELIAQMRGEHCGYGGTYDL